MKFIITYHRGDQNFEEGFYPCVALKGPFKTQEEAFAFLEGLPCVESAEITPAKPVN
jgi:hypothetical protein